MNKIMFPVLSYLSTVFRSVYNSFLSRCQFVKMKIFKVTEKK